MPFIACHLFYITPDIVIAFVDICLVRTEPTAGDRLMWHQIVGDWRPFVEVEHELRRFDIILHIMTIIEQSRIDYGVNERGFRPKFDVSLASDPFQDERNIDNIAIIHVCEVELPFGSSLLAEPEGEQLVQCRREWAENRSHASVGPVVVCIGSSGQVCEYKIARREWARVLVIVLVKVADCWRLVGASSKVLVFVLDKIVQPG